MCTAEIFFSPKQKSALSNQGAKETKAYQAATDGPMPPETGGGRKESQQSHAPTLPQPSITGIRLQSAREGREAWWVELTPNHKWKRSAAPWGVQPEPWTDGSIKYYSIIQQPNRLQIELGRGGPKNSGIDARLLTRGGLRGEPVAIISGS